MADVRIDLRDVAVEAVALVGRRARGPARSNRLGRWRPQHERQAVHRGAERCRGRRDLIGALHAARDRDLVGRFPSVFRLRCGLCRLRCERGRDEPDEHCISSLGRRMLQRERQPAAWSRDRSRIRSWI